MPYTPKPPPRTKPEFQDLYDYIEQELQSISRELLETPALELRTTAKAPARPREGMIVRADGTDWDPGEGAGTYKYESGVWVKFGDASHVHTLVDITDAGALAALDDVDVANISPIDASRVIGRKTAGAGDAEELTLSEVLDFIGSAARGDLLVRGASAWARLAIGASGRVLTSDGTDPSWVVPSGMTLLQSNTTDSGSDSDFINISQNHKVLMFIGREIDSTADSNLDMYAGTTSSFGAVHGERHGYVLASGSTVTGAGFTTSLTGVPVGYSETDADAYFVVLIFDYNSTTKHKVGFVLSGATAATTRFLVDFFVFETNSAIEHIRFECRSSTYVAGTIDMYGLF